MFSRRILSASRLARVRQPIFPRPLFSQHRYASDAPVAPSAITDTEIKATPVPEFEVAELTGGYVQPPPMKRQYRDPWADWWDKQERRNFGEAVHEDNDALGMFFIDDYTHFTARKGFFLMGCFIASVLGLCVAVRMTYPDRPSAPRTWEDGLEKELGGPNALLAPKPSSES